MARVVNGREVFIIEYPTVKISTKNPEIFREIERVLKEKDVSMRSNTAEVLLLRALLKIVHQSDSLLLIPGVLVAAAGVAEQADRLRAGESLLGHQGGDCADKEDEAVA